MTLPAFAVPAARCSQLSNAISSAGCSAANPLATFAAVDLTLTDRQTDTRPLHRPYSALWNDISSAGCSEANPLAAFAAVDP